MDRHSQTSNTFVYNVTTFIFCKHHPGNHTARSSRKEAEILDKLYLTWADIWHYQPLRLKFLLRSVYDLLPSPADLHIWGLVEDPRCHLCDKPGTMQHALSSCQTALAQSRYGWRHDTVLRELADTLELERRKKRNTKK